ncbi:MAG: HEPN domain-containing protein [Blastocatellia bacterium]
MTQLTQEWIDKAEGDWYDALSRYRARKHPNYDSACFHSQQCVEKYLKARLEESGIAFSKTHDLVHLLTLTTQIELQWGALQQHAKALNSYAVDFRYPGKSATKANAKQAIADCREIRRVVRTAFGLPV